MTQIRTELSKNNPLYIDKFAFRTAYYFALQYPKWKRQYAESIGSVIKAVDYNDSPKGTGTGDPTARIAMRTSILHSNIELIECTALMAGRDMAEYILYAVTNEGITYNYLRGGRCKLGRIPCGRNQYYQMRRLFYYLLSQKLEEMNVKG